MAQARYVFSYAREDSTFVLKLAQELRAAGVDLWLDQLDIIGGQRWDRAVENALQTCGGVIAVLSPHSVASDNVMDEVSYALEEGKQLVPILLQPCDVSFRLRRVQYIDFTVGYDAAFASLLRALDVGKPGVASAAPQPEERIARDEAPRASESQSAVDLPVQSRAVGPNASAVWLRRLMGVALGTFCGLLWALILLPFVSSDEPFLFGSLSIAGAIVGALTRRRTLPFALTGGIVAYGLCFALIAASSFDEPVQAALVLGGVYGAPAGAIVGSILGLLVSKRRSIATRAPT